MTMIEILVVLAIMAIGAALVVPMVSGSGASTSDLKSAARQIAAGLRLVTDTEVLLEILHRYTAIDQREAIAPAFRVVLNVVDEVLGIEKADVLRAAEIAQNHTSFTVRDAVHIAVMERHGIRSILSFNADFDRWPGLERIHRI